MVPFLLIAFSLVAGCGNGSGSQGAGLGHVNHIIVLMQENHSFDNHLGALPYVPNGRYHSPPTPGQPCAANDHQCVDGLTACVNGTCANSNFVTPGDPDSEQVFAFHDPRLCFQTDLDHQWTFSHQEMNFLHPTDTLNGLADGFVAVNLAQEGNTDFDTMGFYDQSDLAFYYALAQTFAISDRYFCAALGPTLLNRLYEQAATSFGHVHDSALEDNPPPATGYQPITGTIFDLMDRAHVTWRDYFNLTSHAKLVRGPVQPPDFQPLGSRDDDIPGSFFNDAAAGTLPQVSFVDPDIGIDSEHPNQDVREGQYLAAQIIGAIRNGPNWKDSIILLTYDENGGGYDHVIPPAAPAPDNIPPGQCADLSNPPLSEQPGNGINCSDSAADAAQLCAMGGPPCPGFDQLGPRVPFIAISPFSKPGYVSHVTASHASMLALIEARFLSGAHLTARDAAASNLEDMFDFVNAPSLNAVVPVAMAAPPTPMDANCYKGERVALIAGGLNSVQQPIAAAEFYDPSRDGFIRTGSMITARQGETLTPLADGTVLSAGGMGANGPLASAEVYSPVTGQFTAVGSMSTARYQHTATLLNDGTVLIAGGRNAAGALSSAELYDPATRSFTAVGLMATARAEPTATLLGDGQVLIAGGDTGASATGTSELYDPTSRTFKPTGPMFEPRFQAIATLLPDGTVLIAGGGNASNPALNEAELYEPATGTFAVAAPMHTARRMAAGAPTMLTNGDAQDDAVLIAGGVGADSLPLNSAEIYDDAAGTFTCVGSPRSGECDASMVLPRSGISAIALAGGGVLLAGGQTSTVITTMAERYDPPSTAGTSGAFEAVPNPMSVARAAYGAALLNPSPQ